MFLKLSEYVIRVVIYIVVEGSESKKVGVIDICDYIEVL